MINNEKKAFTKREWIQLIIILTIFQAFFWYAVFENSQSESALGYVSFAGTLVSIILAVLAIGYTYGESISQKNKSEGLADQINTLGTLIESVEVEAKSLEKIQDIATELTGFIGSYKADKQTSESHLRQIRENISKFTKSSDSKTESINKDRLGPLRPVDKLINSNRSPLDEACYLMLVYIENNQDGMGLNMMDELLEDILSDTPMGLPPEFFHGALFTHFSLLKNLGFIEDDTDSEEYKIDEDLKNFIVNNMIKKHSVRAKEGSYEEFISRLYKLVKSTS